MAPPRPLSPTPPHPTPPHPLQRLEMKAMELHRQNLASAKSLTDNGEPHQTFRKYNAKKVEKEQERMFEMDAVRIG